MNKKQIVLIFGVMLCVLYPQSISIGGSVDVNGDGVVNTADLEFVDKYLGRVGEHAADVNDDAVVNIVDLMLVKNAIGPTTRPPRGDAGAMVLIPEGTFQMGSENGNNHERPVHTVHVDAFYMDVYAVTNAQYKAFVDANPQWQKGRIERRFHDGDYLALWNGNDYPVGKGDHPVVHVSWYGAMAYARWAGKRLPTEAEWEKAARGGLVGKEYPWGDTIDDTKANYGYNVGDTTPVGSYPPNAYGLYDMAGNVWEWCLDEYDGNFYANAPAANPVSGAATISEIVDNYINITTAPVWRGGNWSASAPYVRVADRSGDWPTSSFNSLGFRCARTSGWVAQEL